MRVDPRTATPCRTVAFSAAGDVLAEANYLGFVTLRDARTGDLLRRFLAQTALVETVRFEESTGLLLLVGAGFEGSRDCGVVKILDPRSGARLAELAGHSDDATDVMTLPGERRRVVSVGLDRRVVVHDVDDRGRSWAWTDYEDYLNTCAARPAHDGQIAIAGDSPYTYVLDVDARAVVARLDTPGDTNALTWSADGRFVVVGDDAGRLLYFDGHARWKAAGEARVGGAAKRMVADPAAPGRALVACYDGRIWSVPRSPGGGEPFVAVERRRGMWGINVAATATRLSAPSFFDRAYLIARDAQGRALEDIGPEPQPTYGCNWVALHPSRDEIALTHDDARIRVRDASNGALLRVLGPDTESLTMGAAYHPTLPLLATIDFHGELIVYDTARGRVVWRRDMGFGPGIALDISPCGRWLAAGGYHWRGRVLALGDDGLPSAVAELDAPNRGVVKSVAFAGPTRLLVASGDGALVVHDRAGDRFVATRTLRGAPPMELSNGVAAAPDGRVAYVVSRDQSLRAFDLESGAALGTGLAHVRGVKTVHVSECGRHVVTGSYDRTVILWDAHDLTARLPPVRLAGSGVSGVRWRRGRVYACSFDGFVFAVEASRGRIVWHKTAADAADGG
ncbi:MAG TPA: PQQ-binding-like beta-propeller repeat protein [Polyangiaceae bacterium]